MLWPPDENSWIIGKDLDAGKDWRQEKGVTEDGDGWMASPMQWTWNWANSKRWWGTGKPVMEWWRIGHHLVTEQQLLLQVTLVVKNASPMQVRVKRLKFFPWIREVPWRSAWQPTVVFLPGESHEQRSLVGSNPWGCRVGHDWSDSACMYSLQKSSKILLCVYLEVEPGPCPQTALLFLDCLSLVSASFATIWSCSLELRKDHGGWNLVSTNVTWEKQNFCAQEPHRVLCGFTPSFIGFSVSLM